MAVARLVPDRTAVLLVDLQERLVPVMREPQRLVVQAARLLDAAAVLNVPVLVTEQYRKGLGATVPELEQRLTGARARVEKMRFSAYVEPVQQELSRLGARCVLVAGIESHVCVLQTCLDLVEAGYAAAVAVDAVSSRRAVDQDVAIQRMIQAGVVPVTVEAAVMELTQEAGTDRFKAILPLIKA